jgi:hypothetical protein
MLKVKPFSLNSMHHETHTRQKLLSSLLLSETLPALFFLPSPKRPLLLTQILVGYKEFSCLQNILMGYGALHTYSN